MEQLSFDSFSQTDKKKKPITTQAVNELFLASITGMKPSEIAEMPLGDFGELIADVVGKEEFRDFFVRVAGFVK